MCYCLYNSLKNKQNTSKSEGVSNFNFRDVSISAKTISNFGESIMILDEMIDMKKSSLGS